MALPVVLVHGGGHGAWCWGPTIEHMDSEVLAVDLPSGGSWTSFVAPLSIAQAAAEVLKSSPSRLSGEMCARIGLAELKKPIRFCNRYISVSAGLSDDGSVTNAVLSGTASDLGDALSMIDAFNGKPPTVTGVNVLLKVHRGADQAFIRHVSLPRTVRRGQRVRVKVSLHTWKPSAALMSCAVMRTLSPDFRTLPSTTYATPSCFAISGIGTSLPLK